MLRFESTQHLTYTEIDNNCLTGSIWKPWELSNERFTGILPHAFGNLTKL